MKCEQALLEGKGSFFESPDVQFNLILRLITISKAEAKRLQCQ